VRLLITRPLPDAEATAAYLRGRGHQVLVAPLMRLEPMPCAWGTATRWAGVLVTSANALRALPDEARRALSDLPLLAVGGHTAEAARIAGFARVETADGDAGDLARLAVSRFRGADQPLLYLAGADRARDLAQALAPAGIAVETVVVYRMTAERTFPPAVRTALAAGEIDGVLHYSRRSAEAYRTCAAADDVTPQALAPVQYCLSQAVAEAFRNAGAVVRVAARPGEDALLRLIPR
jgi:uroporphyrinogen-III synthase